ncbi:MAG: tetratricopeptide repeat protein [Elusimicrobia bacterium]|nr:tetratricopeptide repeat protein [Elusimicrobiota bacterium]
MIKRLLNSVLLLASFASVSAAAADKEAYLHFMTGMVQERKGNYDTALQEYRRTMLLDPQSVYVYKQALNLALHIGKVDDAAEWAEFVVRTDSATADNWVLYGNVKWARGDLDGARAAYERAVELDPASHEALYQLASLSSSRGPDKAIGYLRKYLELRPEDAAEVYYQIAVLYNAKGDAAGVKENLLKSRQADPYYPQPRYMLASLYELNSDSAAALGEYLELVTLEPKNIELLDRVGELYAGPLLNNLEEGEKYFLKAWALDKKDPAACFWLSVINEQKRDFNAAASYLENSAGLKDDAGLVLRLAYYYTQSGRYERAIALLELAMKKWPDNMEIAYFLALGYDDTGKTDRSRELLRTILAREPENAEARMQYGVISERENDMPAAEESFRYLLRKKPDNANVLNYLGYSLADRGLKLDEAELLIMGAVSLEPENGAFLDSLAWVRFKRGNVQGALEGIKRAVKAVYDDPVIWAHAGDIYEANGENNVAWLAWRKSWLLEKPAKRAKAAARLKELRKKIEPGVLPALELAYLKNFSPSGLEFSSFAKVEAKLRGKTVKFDAILHFSPPSDFNLTVMGPLMVPLWKAKVSGGVMDMDAISIKDIDSGSFSYWASLIAGELSGWFSGEYLEGAKGGGWREPCFTGGGREVCLDPALAWPEEITNKAEGKLSFRPGNYFLKNLYLFPETLDFKLPFVLVKITLDKNQMNFAGANTLKLPD